jgi:hypothetical protein
MANSIERRGRRKACQDGTAGQRHLGAAVEQVPSDGLALVDSMALPEIKAFGCHAQVFPVSQPGFGIRAFESIIRKVSC